MNPTDRQLANVVGGKTARACDSCLRKRARWFCAADDAFLCQGCDSSVHSANQLANRHERVRLATASNKRYESKTLTDDSVPAWHTGFTRKARTPRKSRTPRQHKKDMCVHIYAHAPLVPDCTDDSFFEETEAQLLYRVPVFDPFDAELCNVSNEMMNEPIIQSEYEPNVLVTNNRSDDLENLQDFLPSDMELAVFAADVETLLGKGLDEESCGMEGLGIINCKEEKECFEESRVKIEDDDEVQAIIACSFGAGLDTSKGCLDWNFDEEESPVIGVEEKVEVVKAEAEMVDDENKEMRRTNILSLNYDEVIVAWDNQGCPWTSGIRPELNPDYCCLEFMDGAPDTCHPCGSSGCRRGDGGREARVSRYREKRRTRLFSKKIRYQVRKLNAEKRPRMKGRFVKRTSFAGELSSSTTTIPSYMMNK